MLRRRSEYEARLERLGTSHDTYALVPVVLWRGLRIHCVLLEFCDGEIRVWELANAEEEETP